MRLLVSVAAAVSLLASQGSARAEEEKEPQQQKAQDAAPKAQTARQKKRKQVLEQEKRETAEALERHEREDEESFEKDVRDHPEDKQLHDLWEKREELEKAEREGKRKKRTGGPLDPKSPGERGENAVVRVSFASGAGEESCSASLVGATASTSLLLTRARCVADLADPQAPRPRKLKVEFSFAGAQRLTTEDVLVQKIYPGYLEAIRKGEKPNDGSDLAIVIAAVQPPAKFSLFLTLQLPDVDLRKLAGKPLQVVGFGQRGRGRRDEPLARAADVTSVCGKTPCAGVTNALTLATDDTREACADADAGGAVTAYYPPQVFLVAVLAAHPGKHGTCVAHPLSGQADALLRWVATSAISNDFKLCVRDPRTARVTCRDSTALLRR